MNIILSVGELMNCVTKILRVFLMCAYADKIYIMCAYLHLLLILLIFQVLTNDDVMIGVKQQFAHLLKLTFKLYLL